MKQDSGTGARGVENLLGGDGLYLNCKLKANKTNEFKTILKTLKYYIGLNICDIKWLP